MKKALFLLAALLFSAVWAIAQEGEPIVPPPFPTDPEGLNLEFLMGWTEALYGAALVGVSYLSAKIPGINKIPKTAWRVAVIALVLGMVFLTVGKAAPLALLFSYLGATSLYDLILSLIKKTPKPPAEGTATVTPG